MASPEAAAYANNDMVFLAWRYTLRQKKDQAWSGLGTDDTWQDKYFKVGCVQTEVNFWL